MTRARAALVLGVTAVALGAAAPARASSTQVTILQDDPRIVHHRSPQELDRTLAELRSLGVDYVRVTLFWDLVEPRPDEYSGWERYDRIVRQAKENGVGVLLTVTGAAPRWATVKRRGGWDQPNPGAFADLMAFAGRRYPGVSHWSIWNEPNFARQSPHGSKRRAPVTPKTYRRILRGAWQALAATGHGSDVILIGETAPLSGGFYRGRVRRTIGPLPFVRELYCLDRRYRPYRGRRARRRACPTTAGSRALFPGSNPALFRASGWAHHPYSYRAPPTHRHRKRGVVSFGTLRRLTRTLDRSARRWGGERRLPIWITEYGYQTRPPDPGRGIPWRRQARWLSWAEYLAYRNARIHSFAQFLLHDDAPRGDRRNRWYTWQSGLKTHRGRRKPSWFEFRRPVHVAREGRRGLRVWGAYRETGGTALASLEFRPRGGDWRTLVGGLVAGPHGHLDVRVRRQGRGFIRIAWVDPETGVRRPTRAVGLAR